jgi:hypothetical protein
MRLVWLFSFLLLSGAAIAFGVRGYHAEVWAPGSRVSLLLEDPKAGEAAGLIHGEAKVAKLEGGRVPCTASYRKAKKSSFVTLQEGARIFMEDGRVLLVAKDTGVEFFDEEAPRGLPSEDEKLKIRTELGLNDSHRPEIHCVAPAEPMYVVGCAHPADAAELVACPGDDHVLIAPGRLPVPYVASYAANGAAWLALAMLGAVVGSFAIWRHRAFLRPVVRDLWSHARATSRSGEPRDLFWLIFAGTIVLAAVATLAIRGRSFLYVLTMVAVGLGLAFVYVLIGIRFRMLHAALKIVRGTATGKLGDSGDEIRELAVKVAPDAPLVDPIAGAHRPAFVRARIVETMLVPGSKGSKIEMSAERAVVSYPRRLSILDETAATIDMESCRLDTEPEASLTMKGVLSLPEWAEQVLPTPIEPAAHHSSFTVHWGKLDPGDPLLLYGRVVRQRGGEGDGSAATGGYRSAPINLAVQGKAVAYRGDERELARSLARERRTAVAIAVVLLAAIGATVTAAIHAATLA